MPGFTVQCLVVGLSILRIYFSRRGRYEQEKRGTLVRGDILEGRNRKHLDSGQGPELGCIQDNILEDSVTGSSWFIMDLLTG